MKVHFKNSTINFATKASLLALMSLAGATGVQASNWAWSTVPGNTTFAANNWTSGATPGAAAGTPASGDSLYFGTSSILALTNNESSFTFGGLTFLSGANAFTLTGNPLALVAGAGVTNNSAAAQGITNVISGAGNVVQAGTGTLTLSGANTYSGGTIVSAGTLVAPAAGSLGTNGAAAVNGTLDLNGGAVTYTGLTNGLSGNGTVNVTVGTGSANSILTTAYGNYANFTGTINIGTNGITGASSATVPSSGKGVIFASLGAGTVNVLSNASFFVSGSVTDAANAVLYGGTTGEALGQLRLDGSAVWSGPVTLAGPIISAADGNIGGNSGTPYITGSVGQTGGAQSLIKIGGATVVLAGTNTYTGNTIVNGGTLAVIGNQTNSYASFYVGTNSAAVGLAIGLTTQTSPTKLNVSPNATVVTASGASAYSTINVYGASGNPTVVTNNGTMSIGRDSGFAVNNYATWVQNSNLLVQANGGYPGNFTVSAGGTYLYNGFNPAVISAPVSSGSANINDAGNFVTATNIVFNDNGSTGYPYFVLNGGSLTLGNNLNPLFTSTRTNTGPLGQVQVGVNGTLNTAGFNTTITNVIANASGANGSLVVSGAGAVTLSAYNTYTGGTTVSNGTTLVLTTTGGTGTIRNNLTIDPGAVVSLNNGDALGFNGANLAVTNVNIYGGMMTNVGAGFYQSYDAYYNLSGGTVGSAGGPFTFSGQGIASLSNNVPSVFNAPVRLVANSFSLSAAAGNVPGGVDLNILGGIYESATVASVTKTGAGEVQLAANNSYTGSTLINAGTLSLGPTAALSASTNISISAGATFDVSQVSGGFTLGGSQAISGSGTVNGSMTDSSGSQLNPGGINTVGTLTINGALNLVGGDTLNYDFSAGGSNDVLNVIGALNPTAANGPTAINLANWPAGGFHQTNYVLITAASLGGSPGSSFSLLNPPSGGRQSYALVYNTSTSPQQVQLQVSGFNATLLWVGGGGNPWDVQLDNDWLNNGAADAFYTSDNVIFSNVPPANAVVNVAGGPLAPGSVTFFGTNNYSFPGGSITGGASLTLNQTGPGSVTFNTVNDYTGGTFINSGSLVLGDGFANNGSVFGNIQNNGTLVVTNPSPQILTNNISGSGPILASGLDTLTVSGNISGASQVAVKGVGAVTISGNVSNVTQVVANGSGGLTLTGNFSGTGQLVAGSTGGVTLSGNNSYAGGTFVTNGALVAASATALGVPASGVLATLSNGGILAYEAAGTQTLTNQIIGAGSLTYSNGNPGTAGQPLNYGLVGLVLAASNNFSGGLTMNVGSVYAYNNHALGTGPVTIDNGNGYGTYGFNQLFVGNGLNISNAIIVQNGGDWFDGVLMVDPGPNNSYGASDVNGGTFSGPITLASGAVIQHGGLFCGPGNGTNYLFINGPVTNLNSGQAIVMRNGRARFSGGGSYDAFDAAGGVTQIGANNGLATNAALVIGGGSFDMNGFNQSLTGLSNPGGGIVTDTSVNPSILTLDLAAASSYSGIISGKISLVLNGSSVLTLSGTNTYTGNTTVNGATLELAQNVPTLATGSILSLANGAVAQLDQAVTNQVEALVLDGTNQPAGVYNSTTLPQYISNSGTILVQPSTNDSLASLVVSNSTAALGLNPVFAINSYVYHTTNAYQSGPVSVTVAAADQTATATLSINGSAAVALTNGLASLPQTLGVGSNSVFTVQVVSGSGAATNYTVDVYQQGPPLSTNDLLTSLVVSNTTTALSLSPVFAATNSGAYLATNAFTGGGVTVTVTNADSSETNTLYVNGNYEGFITSGIPSIAFTLGAGSNSVLTVQVVSQSGATNLYSVDIYQQTQSLSVNAFLSSLVLSNNLNAAVTLTPGFGAGTYAYSATNTLPANQVDVTVTDADPTATNTLWINSVLAGPLVAGTPSGLYPLNAGSNNVAVQVVSQSGTVTNLYTVNLFDQPSLANPKLATSVANGTLSLSWDANHLGYRLLVQTNNQSRGVSTNTLDWGTLAGSTGITSTNIAIPRSAGATNGFYRLVYP